ncbi:hypothetical protein [Streptomyces sp. NBRC 109706]|uniref:hypothetical protein n=1 Tax=Streptomyces sp. NBRC 109706 TaxID=1550035 RepID=UPI00078626C7|nr:hypothetical protein [Streptomyces sp. NBRC 109706]
MIPARPLPEWMPSEAAGAAVLETGRWWDAVRQRDLEGLVTVEALRRRGPVIRNQVNGTFAWLIPIGAADGWSLPDHTEVLSGGRRLAVPAASLVHTAWTGGLGVAGPATSWYVRPEGDCLTDPDALHRALHVAAAAPR